MTLQDAIRVLEAAAAAQPAVGSICRHDVYRLNAFPGPRYGVFSWLQGEHTADLERGVWRFQFTLFYVDRLTHDGGNLTDVQSTGLEVLRNILLTVQAAGLWVSGTPSFDVFREKFLDTCGGAFCRVTFEVIQGSICPEEFTSENMKILYI